MERTPVVSSKRCVFRGLAACQVMLFAAPCSGNGEQVLRALRYFVPLRVRRKRVLAEALSLRKASNALTESREQRAVGGEWRVFRGLAACQVMRCSLLTVQIAENRFCVLCGTSCLCG